MPEKEERERIHPFYRDLCIAFVACLRALSMYPPEHPETAKKTGDFMKRLNKVLSQRTGVTLLFVGGDVIVENLRLPELSQPLEKLLRRFEAANFERLMFRQGLSQEELMLFFQLLLPLLKNPSGADLVMAKNQDRLPHILASRLPLEAGPKISYEEFSSALQGARNSILSFSDKLKDLFSLIEGPLPESKVTIAREVTETIQKLVTTGDMPLKILIYRRSPDPDPYIHAINVCALSMALAWQVKVVKPIAFVIGLAGLLHDIGLYLSPAVALSKTAAITLDEKKKMWEHPIRGAEVLLASKGIPDLAPIVAYEHHLHYNGGGYPEQKHPRDLNLASMITCITDTYDNLRRNRPEQNALSLTDALNWMDSRQSKEFHPLLLKQFRAMVKAQAQEEV